MRRRVVITGAGAVTPIGIGVENVWEAACQGRSGIGPITLFDASSFQTKIAGEVKNFNPQDFIDKKHVKRMDRFTQFAMVSSIIAVEDSNIKFSSDISEKCGIIFGVGLGGISTIEQNHSVLLEKGPKRVSPLFVPMIIGNMAPGYISIYFGIKGVTETISTACASSTHAIGEAYRMIREGFIKLAIAGGAEAAVSPLSVAGFNSMKALSTRNEEPERASRPFDKERDGFVPAEGAAALILEDMEHALSRGAKIYAEIIGYGASSDAYHITAPDPEGIGASKCMENALLDAKIDPGDVDYINAHGTSTPLNDVTEVKAIKRVFGEHAYRIPISSSKSMVGHMLGAAGAAEAFFTIFSIKEGKIHPTINYEYKDPECDLDFVPNVARDLDVKIAISNSFGFGGHNATLVFKKFEE